MYINTVSKVTQDVCTEDNNLSREYFHIRDARGPQTVRPFQPLNRRSDNVQALTPGPDNDVNEVNKELELVI